MIEEYCLIYVFLSMVSLSLPNYPVTLTLTLFGWEWGGEGVAGAESLSDTPLLYIQAELEIATQGQWPTRGHFMKSPDIITLQKQSPLAMQ